MGILIRCLTHEDESFLWDALYHAIHVPPDHKPPPQSIVRQPELARYVAGWMENPNDMGFVMEVDDSVVGAAWLRCWTDINKGYGYVNDEIPELSMSLLPHHRGYGLGTTLLRRLLSAAATRFEAVSLSVSETNPAMHLYAREGFIRCGDPVAGSVTMLLEFQQPSC